MGHENALQRHEADPLGRGGLVRMVKCNLPDNSDIQEKVKKRFSRFSNQSWLFEHVSGQSQKKSTNQQLNSPTPPPVPTDWEYVCTEYVITTYCSIDPETGEIYGCETKDPECFNYGWVYIDESSGESTPTEDEGDTPTGPSGGGSGGAGGDPCSGLEEESWVNCTHETENIEPCETGDPVLDDPQVQEGMRDLWEASNYGSDDDPNPESERKEQLAFIIPDGFGGYNVDSANHLYIGEPGPCNVNFKKPENLPEGTILIHTQPYKSGDVQKECVPGETFEYNNDVGEKDRPTLDSLGLERGIILDAEQIISFTPNENEEPDREERCGY